MNKKYFFFDIDGTLTNKDTGKIVPSAKEAIRLLQENGHFVAIATGRAYYKTIAFAKEMGIHYIVSNGGAAITMNDELIENKPLDHDKAVALCHEAQEKGFGVLISTDDSIDVSMVDDRFIHQVGYRKEPTRYFLYQDRTYEDFPNIYKIYVAIPKEREHELSLLKSLGYIRFMPDYLTYQHDEKDNGIRRMIELVDGKLEDVVVFGDDYNDLVMFHKEWMSIAMGNACQELKKQAKFVTKKSTDDGIMYACQYFKWI